MTLLFLQPEMSIGQHNKKMLVDTRKYFRSQTLHTSEQVFADFLNTYNFTKFCFLILAYQSMTQKLLLTAVVLNADYILSWHDFLLCWPTSMKDVRATLCAQYRNITQYQFQLIFFPIILQRTLQINTRTYFDQNKLDWFILGHLYFSRSP